MLVNKKSNSQVTIKKIICDKKCYTDKVSIARQLNNYYINVGRNLADTLPRNDTEPTHHITRSFQSSFMFWGICTQEAYDAIMNINLKKSTISTLSALTQVFEQLVYITLKSTIFSFSFNLASEKVIQQRKLSVKLRIV